MAKMKTLTLNGETYTVDDPDSVSYEEEQNLSDDEKAKARGNIGAASVEDLEAVREAAASAIVCEASGEVIAVSNASDRQLQGLTLYGKTTQGEREEEIIMQYALYSSGSDGDIEVDISGKNIYKGEYYGGYQQTPIPNGAAYGGSSKAVYVLYIEVKKGVTYTITTYKAATSTTKSRIGFTAIHPKSLVNGVSPCAGYQELSPGVNTATATAPFDGWLTILAYSVGDGRDNLPIETQIKMFQVEVGEKSTEYEPYKAAQTLTAQTPNGLPGIPVSSGGNYTDANGQQRICDYKDYVNGVYVQKIKRLYASEIKVSEKTVINENVSRFDCWLPDAKIGNGFAMCDYFKQSLTWLDDTSELLQIERVASNPTKSGVSFFTSRLKDWTVDEFNENFLGDGGARPELIYALEKPIITHIPEGEMAAFATLHTNKPNTTVFNDSNAGMKVEYVADSKSYIDNNIAKQAADDSTVGGAPWSSRNICENFAVRTQENTNIWVGKPVEGSTITANIRGSFTEDGEPYEPVIRHFGMNLLGREREGEGFSKTEVANCGVTITRKPIYRYDTDYENGGEIEILATEDGDGMEGTASSDFSYVRSIITLYPGTYTLCEKMLNSGGIAFVATSADGGVLARVDFTNGSATFTLEKTTEVWFAYSVAKGTTFYGETYYPFLVVGDTLYKDAKGNYIYYPEYKCETITYDFAAVMERGGRAELKAYPGINTILMPPHDGYSFTRSNVEYYEQPQAAIERLTNAIIALGGNI